MASGLTARSIIVRLIETRRSQMHEMLLRTGAKEKKAREVSEDMAAGMRQMATDLAAMDIIEIAEEDK